MELHFDTRGNEKQKEAARRWIDDTTEQILFGGAKYGGKSFLGANLIFGDAMLYPETHYFIARDSLTDLRKYTVPTIHEVFDSWNLNYARFLKYNGQDNYFTLPNKSKIFLIDGSYMPSDPDYHRFGSMQFTRGWCEEIGGMHPKAISNLFLAVGRWKNKEYGLKKKLLLTCNPHKGYGYSEFYKPHQDGTLPPSKAFIISLPQDNKSGDQDYILSLKNNPDKNERERLYYGNWQYDSDPATLIDYDSIIDLFSNTYVEKGDSYITADIARFGRDNTVIIVWSGLRAEHVHVLSQESTTEVTKEINRLRELHKVPLSRITIDEDGVGCLNESTEVLTNYGWKMSTDIREGDCIISKSGSGEMELSNVIKVIHHESERFINIDNKIEFTSSHSHFYKVRGEHRYKLGYWDSITEKSRITHDTGVSLPEYNGRIFKFESTKIKMPHGGVKNINNELNINGISFAKFLGWFISEGHTEDHNGKYIIGITQKSIRKENEDIINTLNECGIKFSTKTNKSGEIQYTIQHKSLFEWIRGECYAKGIKRDALSIKLPDYLKHSSKDEFSAFCSEFIKGDGYYHNGAMQFCSSSKRLIDDIQEGLFFCCGISSRIHVKHRAGSIGYIHGRKITRTTDHYVLSEIFKNTGLVMKNKTERYGKAINIKLDNETKAMLIRQGKYVFWTHNGGVVDQLQCHGFVNNSRPEFKENFTNLKSQCYFKLADLINAGEIYVNCNQDIKTALIEELEQVKQKDMDKDGKKAVIGKDKVKELIGRSPDISDALMMRMHYELEDTEFAVV